MTEETGALIAMSGGVDSSVAAWLTLSSGLPCLGATMRLYRNEDLGRSSLRTCCAQRDIDDAAQVAFLLNLPYEILDLTGAFHAQVMDKFAATYEAGGTPNPCIDCNRFLKFDALLALARERGLSHVVTGHYARIVYDENLGRWLLKKGLDESKDQSYVLYTLTQDQLAHTRFPLGERRKADIRALAAKLGFPNAEKADSQDICFVPDGDYGAFLERYTGRTYPAGFFLDQAGQPVGRHKGAVRYTLGQRKGLGLSLGEPVYVCGKDMAANTVTVGPEAALYRQSLLADEVNWIALERLTSPARWKAKTRYRQQEAWATVSPLDGGRIQVTFDQPQRAITPGQAVVLYDGDTVVGGGTIRTVLDRPAERS